MPAGVRPAGTPRPGACLQRPLDLEGHRLARHPAPVVQLGQVHLGQLPGRHAGRLGVQEVVQDTPSSDGLQPDLHGAGQRAGHRPAVPRRAAVLDHRQPQVGPPPPPARRVGDRRADVDRVGADEGLVRDLDAVHRRLASHMRSPPRRRRPTRLDRGTVTRADPVGEARTVREFSVPASFTVGEHDNVVSSVFAHERDDPDHVIFQRLVDGDVGGRDLRPGRRPDPFGGTGFDRRGGQPGDRVAILSATRYEWPILDFAILSDRRGHRADLRDLARPSRCASCSPTPARCWRSPRPTRTPTRSSSSRASCPTCARCCASTAPGTPALDELAEAGERYDAGASSTTGWRPSSRPTPRR